MLLMIKKLQLYIKTDTLSALSSGEREDILKNNKPISQLFKVCSKII